MKSKRRKTNKKITFNRKPRCLTQQSSPPTFLVITLMSIWDSWEWLGWILLTTTFLTIMPLLSWPVRTGRGKGGGKCNHMNKRGVETIEKRIMLLQSIMWLDLWTAKAAKPRGTRARGMARARLAPQANTRLRTRPFLVELQPLWLILQMESL